MTVSTAVTPDVIATALGRTAPISPTADDSPPAPQSVIAL